MRTLPRSGPFRLVLLAALLACGIATASALTAPTPSAPANAGTGYMPNPNFSWSAPTGALTYNIQIASNSGFTTILASSTGYLTRFVPATALPAGVCYWRVQAVAADGVTTSPWSSTFTYTVANPSHTYTVASTDTLTTIRSTLATAIANPPAKVTFAAGASYAFSLTDTYLLTIKNAHDLILDGNGSLITIENPASGFVTVSQSQRIDVRNFKVDYNPIPMAIGTVEGVNTSTGVITVRRMPGYPDFNSPAMLAGWSFAAILDKNNPGWLKPGVDQNFYFTSTAVTKSPTDPDVFTLPLTTVAPATQFALTDKVVVFAGTTASYLGNVANASCEDITWDNIIDYTCPSLHYASIFGTQVKILNCQSTLKDGTRWFAGASDGVHFEANPMGPWIENLTLHGTGDDGIALYNKGMSIESAISTTEVNVAGSDMNLAVNDTFRIYHPQTGAIYGSSVYTVTAVAAGTVAGTYNITFTPATTDTLTVGNSDPSLNDQLFNVTRRNSNFMVRNCTFNGVRRFAVIARSYVGEISNNSFQGVTWCPVALFNEPATYYNGLYSGTIYVMNNTMNHCGFSTPMVGLGNIAVRFMSLTGHSAARMQAGITISGNQINDWGQSAISLEEANVCTVSGNVISSDVSTYPVTGNHYGIYVNDTSTCSILNNDLSGEGRTMTSPISITNSTGAVNSGNILP